MVITTKDGKRLYPVCSWEQNQHKFYNAIDRIWCAIYDAQEAKEDTSGLYDELERVEALLGKFDAGVRRDGLVYAEYEVGQQMKELIWAYNARH